MDIDDIFERASHYSGNDATNNLDNDDMDDADDLHFHDHFASSPTSSYDPDTCRICRSEGTPDDPLYYPCKCSGSIRFVHQSCLMEWLSHSQKKHCELCKTSFQFTRIYDPMMPAELPMFVFCKKLLLHVYRNVLFWLRCILVVSIWLGWLPFMMRVFWKGLFWLADGRWPLDLGGGRSESESGAASQNNATVVAANVSIAATISTPLPPATSPTPPFSMFNLTFADLLPRFIKKIFLNAAKRRGDASAPFANRSSWLSDFAIFKRLTPYPTLNNIIIDVLEGQIITLSVVISFVLLFLIREWVVQRQPIIGLEDLQVGAHDVPPPPQPQPAQHEHAEQGQVQEEEEEEEAEGEEEGEAHGHAEEIDGGQQMQGPAETANELYDLLRPHNNNNEEESLDEHPPLNPADTELSVFQDVWVRSNGEPEEIVRIIRDERIDRLEWVLPIMERMIALPEESNAPEEEGNAEDGVVVNVDGRQELDNIRNAESSRSSQTEVAARRNVTDTPDAQEPAPSITSSVQSYAAEHGSQSDSRRRASWATRDSEDRPAEEERGADIHEEYHTLPTGETEHRQQEETTPELVDVTHEVHEVRGEPAHYKPLYERVLDYFWGDLPPLNPPIQREPTGREHRRRGEDVAEVIENREFEEVEDEDEEDNANADNEALDIDAIDDADDLEGILELIGVHGPLMNLFQNAVFSTLLVSFTVAAAIWLPYLWGKIALVLLTNPIRLFVGVPITTMSIVADIIVDTCIGSFGYIFYFASMILRAVLQPLGRVLPLPWYSGSNRDPLSSVSMSLVNGSGLRLKRLMDALISFNDADLPVFSIVAHKALLTHQHRIKTTITFIINTTRLISYDVPRSLLEKQTRQGLLKAVSNFDYSVPVNSVYNFAMSSWKSLLPFLDKSKWTSVKAHEIGSASIPLDYSLAHWGTRDRLIAVLVGYCFVALLCMLYLHTRSLFHSPETDPPESAISEALRQAGGVLKVIFIVGIEMIVFPLYCGLLLDVALLPLFENTTLASRIAFTIDSPMTSLFVHWFVGTCYMFHFALFVSMCRKLMRTGVLYFIRDPDDPTFHPVRDVLERSISTQLRKIGFSALIYGGLIIVCCGGVVWSMDFMSGNILPLRWTSHHPMLEVPVDLLFYNFIMPIATKQLKVSDWMYSMYGWWFCKCARALRLSQFLLGVRRKSEEGRLVYDSWRDAIFNRHTARYTLKTDRGEIIPPKAKFVKEGRYVRAPGSDQVRIPKEFTVFLEVTEDNQRLDGKPDRDEGIHGRKSKNFAKVYIPPNFKARIMAFVFLIWIFVAVTGVGCSIGPLLVGRWAISLLVPADIQVNDIYAFSTGVYILGIILYIGYHCYKAIDRQKRRGRRPRQSLLQYLRGSVYRFLGSAYLALAFVIVLPTLFAMMMELYILVPLHTTLSPDQDHVIYSVQDWALGVLYLRMAICFISARSHSRPAQALRAIVRKGWLMPDVRLATRAFILPATLLSVMSILAPIPVGFAFNALMLRPTDPEASALVYRAAYPFTLGIAILVGSGIAVGQMIKNLRTDLRDDVYLIGERLHNFGERPAQDIGASRPMMGI